MMAHLDAALTRGRAAAEALMVDTCIIQHVAGSTTDPNSGVETPTHSTVYTGKCRIQQRSEASAIQADAGEAALRLLRVELQVPMSVTGVQVSDLVTITASARDAELVGKIFLITDLAAKTHATARRFGVVRRTS